MNILILGAGRVGESVAESLASEQNDITVIDTDPARLAVLQDRLDLRGVAGNGIQPSVLKEAGIPYIAFKYAENSGQMQPIREQAGTFADSIKLWSAA